MQLPGWRGSSKFAHTKDSLKNSLGVGMGLLRQEFSSSLLLGVTLVTGSG
jgi:hypothetical protein